MGNTSASLNSVCTILQIDTLLFYTLLFYYILLYECIYWKGGIDSAGAIRKVYFLADICWHSLKRMQCDRSTTFDNGKQTRMGGYSSYNACCTNLFLQMKLSIQCFDQWFCWPFITFSPMSILLKVKVCKWLLEARILGAIFSTKSFSMYWPKKGQAWARICHRVKISLLSIFTQPWLAREGTTELIASHLIEPFSFLDIWKTDLERKRKYRLI